MRIGAAKAEGAHRRIARRAAARPGLRRGQRMKRRPLEAHARVRRAQVQRKYDQSLLLRYSSVDEIAEARDRALHQIDMRIDILHNNLNSVKQQIEAQQAKAADFERDGRTVPTTLARYIEDLKQEIVHAESRIRQRRKDRVDTADAYARDIDRFRQLTKNSDRQARQPD